MRARLTTLLTMTLIAAAPIVAFMPAPAQAITAPAAQSFVLSLGNQGLAILGNTTIDKQTMRTQLQTLFTENVDMDWISRFVIGRYWRTLTPKQQADYTTAYRNFIIKHYTSNFVEYTRGTTFKVTRATPLPREEQMVSTDIIRAGKPPVVLEYRIRQKSDMPKPRVIDIVVEGVSMITTQREEFAAVMQREGMDHLIAQLKQRADAADKKANVADSK
jgi:phospholipid transport system substrate-binding protein